MFSLIDIARINDMIKPIPALKVSLPIMLNASL